MRKILIILLVILGVLIMLKPVSALIKDSQENIIYRGNVVTGTVATDNGNGSYDVYIGESAEAYPSIFTLAENPDLEVGDKVRILYENGIKELPIILPPRAAVSAYIFVVYESGGKDYINSYTTNGEYIKTFAITKMARTHGNPITVDKYNNIYYIDYHADEWDIIKKYNKDGNLLLSKNVYFSKAIAIGPDGYLYCNDIIDFVTSGFIKRELSDLKPIDLFTFNESTNASALAIDSSGYLYFYITSTNIVKYDFATASELARLSGGAQEVAGLRTTMAIAGDLIAALPYWGYAGEYIYARTIPISLSQNQSSWDLSGIDVPIGVASINGDFVFCGTSGSDVKLARYTTSRNKVWEKVIGNTSEMDLLEVAAYPF